MDAIKYLSTYLTFDELYKLCATNREYLTLCNDENLIYRYRERHGDIRAVTDSFPEGVNWRWVNKFADLLDSINVTDPIDWHKIKYYIPIVNQMFTDDTYYPLFEVPNTKLYLEKQAHEHDIVITVGYYLDPTDADMEIYLHIVNDMENLFGQGDDHDDKTIFYIPIAFDPDEEIEPEIDILKVKNYLIALLYKYNGELFVD